VSLSISINVTVPENILQSDAVRSQIFRKMQTKSAPDVRRLFMRTVTGWSDQPNFLQKVTNGSSAITAQIWPSQNTPGGKIYTIVNNGSKPHTIRPKKARMLRFQRGYTASTRPRVLSSRASARFGEFVGAYQVNHPGFEARDFDVTIAETYAPIFEKDMQDVVRSATLRK